MANRYLVGGGTGNWNSTTNWSDTDGGAGGFSFPTVADAVFLTAASGAINLTVNVTSACLSFNCTGFTGNLTMTAGLSASGSVTLSASMTVSGSGSLSVLTNSTITSNGLVWPNILVLSGQVTHTLGDAWVCNALTLGVQPVAVDSSRL